VLIAGAGHGGAAGQGGDPDQDAQGGAGGAGFGAGGGGGGNYRIGAVGGEGATGVVYVEWGGVIAAQPGSARVATR
jgi:hypothetical protein